MDIQPEKLDLGRTSCLSSCLLSASLPGATHTVFLIAKVKYVCHLTVLELWNVEDQQVRYSFVLVACSAFDPNSSISLGNLGFFKNTSSLLRFQQNVVQIVFFLIQTNKEMQTLRVCHILHFCILTKQLSSGVAVKIAVGVLSVCDCCYY